MNGPAARSRLADVEREMEKLQARTKELTASAEKTKAQLVEAANGTYLKVQEILNGARSKD